MASTITNAGKCPGKRISGVGPRQAGTLLSLKWVENV